MEKFRNSIDGFVELCTKVGLIQVNGQQDLKIDFKSDKSPVTNIDLLSNEMIVDYLSKEFSDDVVISEESIKKVGHADSYWLIDPIDGTKDYIKGGSQYCICLSYIENNYPVFGIIYIPSTKDFFYGIKGHGSYLINNSHKSTRLNVDRQIEDNIYVSTTIRKSVSSILTANFSNSTMIYLSSAIKFSCIAQGMGHFSLRLGPTYEWDTAAGQCIIEESGGQFLDKNLKRFSYGKDTNYLNGPFFIFNGELTTYKNTINQCLSLI